MHRMGFGHVKVPGHIFNMPKAHPVNRRRPEMRALQNVMPEIEAGTVTGTDLYIFRLVHDGKPKGLSSEAGLRRTKFTTIKSR